MNIFSSFKKGSIDYILVGLGNPGDNYKTTRHNVGFTCIDYIAGKLNIQLKKLKFSALTEKIEINGKSVLFMKPQTFMNNSGSAVSMAARFYKLPPERIIVISDDVSLSCGTVRMRKKGSAGGHNGLKSIAACIGSEEYPRIKIGVGQKPFPEYDMADWVLSSPSAEDTKLIEARFDDLFSALTDITKRDIDFAMNVLNGKK